MENVSAIDAGVDVRGYHAWSLMDDYEWSHGMEAKFGLCAVRLAVEETSSRVSVRSELFESRVPRVSLDFSRHCVTA